MTTASSKKLAVMVTGVGGGGHGEQIIKALRLSSIPYEIIGGDMSPVSKGLMEVDIPYLFPPADDSRYLPSLLAVCRKHGVKALFHGSEKELKVLSQKRDVFQREEIFLPINPQSVIDLCMDKFKTAEFLSTQGFECPKTVLVSSPADLERIDFFPTILKPSVGGGGSVNVFLAQNGDELDTFGRYLLNDYREFIAQEYVGTPDSEFTVGVLISMDGELLNSIAVKRAIVTSLSNRLKTGNRTAKQSLGAILAVSSGISQGEIGPFPEVSRSCERLTLALGCRGAVNIQCRFVDRKVYVFEINPRFSGTTSLRAMVGYNEPDLLIRRHVLKEKIQPRFSYKSGIVMRGLQEIFVDKADFPKAADLL